MAALPTTRMTLADLAKRMDPNGEVTHVVELLAQRGWKQLQGYMPWQPGNLPTGHQFSVRTAEPEAHLRDYNDGVPPSKSAVAQVVETCSKIEAWAEIDAAEANLNGKAAAFRAQENTAFISAITKKFMQLLLYGNPATDQKEFKGLAIRNNSIANANVVDCGGDNAATNTSIYMMQLGDEFFGIYPPGSQAGWTEEDLGKQVIQFADGKRMLALMTQYVWDCGLVCRNWKRTGRAANIKVADLRARANTQAIGAATNIMYALVDLLAMLPDEEGTTVLLANTTVIAALAKMAMDRSQNVLTIEQGIDQVGKPWRQVQFLGVPFVNCDRILNTESKVA